MAVTDDPQTSIDERLVEDPDLEALLERRHAANEKKKDAAKAFGKVDEEAKGKLADLDVDEDTPVRVGRFVVKKIVTEEAEVQFVRGGQERLSISTPKTAAGD